MKTKPHKIAFVFSILWISLFFACKQTPLIDQNFSLNNEEWTYKNKLIADIDISDTTALYNVYFNLRHTEGYKYQNLYALVSLSPKGTKKPKNTRYQFQVAHPDGKWIGSGSGAIYSLKLPLLTHHRFPKAGKYTLVIEQNMRDNPLKNISDMGFSVEQSQD